MAREAGRVTTREGVTHDQAGDYPVFNEEEGGDAYAVPAEKFARRCEPAG